MVAVPADGTGDVQGDLIEEGEQSRNLVGDHLGGVIVAIIQKGDALVAVHGGIAEGKLGRTGGECLYADAKDLGLHAGLDHPEIVVLRENLVNRSLVAHTGTHAVGGNVLEAVAGPDVHHTGLPQLLGKVGGDADAGLAVLHPEFAHFFVGRGQRQGIAHRVGEESGVKVAAQAPLLAVGHPFGEMFGLQLVAVGPISVVKHGVAGVEVHFLRAGAEFEHHIDVIHQLLRGAGTAGIVAGGLNAAGKGLVGVGVKAADIVALPAVERDGNGLQLFDSSIGVDAQCGVFRLSFHIAHNQMTSI